MIVRLPRTFFALLLLLAAGDARAYVRSRTDKGTPVFWNNSAAWLQLDETGAQDLPFTTIQAIVSKSIANWQTVTYDAGCSYLKIWEDPPVATDAHLDNMNSIKFRSDKWCRPAEKNSAEVCYSAQAAAITTVFYTSAPGKPGDGAIVDADIQMNEINFTFIWINKEVPTIRPGTAQSDLENTLTHELGHFQGLDHTCKDAASTGTPIDDMGNPIPACDDVPSLPVDQRQRIVQATMFNFATAGETIKRTPKADDIAGVCQGAAPVASDPKTYLHPQPRGSCSVGGPSSPAPTLPALFLLLGASVVRARRQSRSARRTPAAREGAAALGCD